MRGEQIYLEARPILLIKKRCSRGRDSYSRGSFVSDLDDPAAGIRFGQRRIKRRALGSRQRRGTKGERKECRDGKKQRLGGGFGRVW